jgi:hypothetical protein
LFDLRAEIFGHNPSAFFSFPFDLHKKKNRKFPRSTTFSISIMTMETGKYRLAAKKKIHNMSFLNFFFSPFSVRSNSRRSNQTPDVSKVSISW